LYWCTLAELKADYVRRSALEGACCVASTCEREDVADAGPGQQLLPPSSPVNQYDTRHDQHIWTIVGYNLSVEFIN
jgi:hypothetical protein